MNFAFVERMAKALLWVAGGYKIYIAGSDVVGEKINADGSVQAYEGLAPIYGEPLDEYLFDDGFYQWTSDEIQSIQ